MPLHWTYVNADGSSDLQQGDILRPTDELMSLLKEVHPHFTDSKYWGFAVITQSCDLVRRKADDCKARYISLAVIRSIEELLPRWLAHTCKPIAPGIYVKQDKLLAKQLLQRILNQNEQSLGVFYLHADSELGLIDSSVIQLRVSVSLRSDHYQKLIDARCGRLATEYSAKLGWLTGNLYSRVATTDWSDQPEGQKEMERIVSDLLKATVDDNVVVWVDEERAKAAKRNGADLDSATIESIEDLLNKHQDPPKIEIAINRVIERLTELGINDPELLNSLQKRLRNDGPFRKTLK